MEIPMRDRIDDAFKTAMKSRDPVRLSTLRLIRAAITESDIAARGAEDGGGVDDASVMSLLQKMIKQREDSADLYESGGRVELCEREREEIAIIREFLPKPMSDEEVDAAVAQAVAETEATSLKDMGAVMGHLRTGYLGRMDFGAAGKKVKAALAG
jgi:uncharacterized protein YqeY